VLDAVIAPMRDGLSFGVPNALEVTMAETIARLVPSCEMVRMVNSGTEATLSAIRLARGATGRARIVKFEGCYHGHGDSFLVKAGSGALTLGVPTSPGVPKRARRPHAHAAVQRLRRGDRVVRRLRRRHRRPDRRARRRQRQLHPAARRLPAAPARAVHAHGALLIFDEVMTGFRVALGGAQRVTASRPTSTFGKIIGGGMPVGAYGGRADLMEQIAPSGPIYQAGTLSGNPVAMAAGLATLELIQAPGFHAALERAHARSCATARSRRARGRRAVHHHAQARCSACSSARTGRATRRRSPATPRRSTASSTRCSSAACTSRRRRSRPASCRARTAIAATLEIARTLDLAARAPPSRDRSRSGSRCMRVVRCRYDAACRGSDALFDAAWRDARRRDAARRVDYDSSCSNSTEIPSGERTNAMCPSRGGR
jgi:hypothetical protein